MNDWLDPIASYNESAEAKGNDPIPTWEQVDELLKETEGERMSDQLATPTDDLRDLLDALGLFSGARPMSPHRVMRLCIETVRIRNGDACNHSCGGPGFQATPEGPMMNGCYACGETVSWVSA